MWDIAYNNVNASCWDAFASYCSYMYPFALQLPHSIMTLLCPNFYKYVMSYIVHNHLVGFRKSLSRWISVYIGHLVFPCTLHLCFIFLFSVFNLTFFYFIFFQVRDVRLIMDRNSRRSKGVGYVPDVKQYYTCVHVLL